jgi:hypothetical protein
MGVGKRIIVLCASVGALGAIAVPSALAGPPDGGCPPSRGAAAQWERVTVQSLVDAGLIVAGAQAVDLNGNGFTCAMFPPNQVLPTIRDDTVPLIAT